MNKILVAGIIVVLAAGLIGGYPYYSNLNTLAPILSPTPKNTPSPTLASSPSPAASPRPSPTLTPTPSQLPSPTSPSTTAPPTTKPPTSVPPITAPATTAPATTPTAPPTTPPPTPTPSPTPPPSPTPTPTLIPSPTPTFTPTPITSIYIKDYNLYFDSRGSMHIFGVVENNGTTALAFVTVGVRMYNASDTLVATDSTYIELETILPTEKSPFEIFVYDPLVFSRYELSILNYDITAEMPYRDLAFLSHSDSIDQSGFLHVVGEVENNGNSTVSFVEICGIFYNSTGNVVLTAWTYTLEEPILPNQIGTFDFLVIYNDIIQMIDHYDLMAQGEAQLIPP